MDTKHFSSEGGRNKLAFAFGCTTKLLGKNWRNHAHLRF